MKLKITTAYDKKEEIAELFQAYTDMLIAGDQTFAEYLKLQNYDQELAHLEEKYGLPDGRLYIAYADGAPAGCIGLRRLDDKSCEMKRLYVKPEFRGHKIGDQLIQTILADAKEIGYEAMYLDTLPFLKSAVKKYEAYGFHETTCYNNSPMKDSIYMRLDIK